MDTEMILTICLGIASAITAVITSVISAMKSKSAVEKINRIVEENGEKLYITCPKCAERIFLNSVKIRKEE